MLADQADRDLIASEADQLLFVEAGAGTGKTTVLVERIVSMVTGAGGFEPVPMPAIAAITFTEKAAAELRNRVRAELSKALQTVSDRERQLVQVALGELDGAAVSTLHGFARRILAEHPIEAGLPPSFDTLDEIASDVAFDERWEAFLSELLSDESMRWPIGMLDAVGVSTDHLRDLARALNDNSDRLEWPAHAAAMLPLETTEIESAAADLLQRRRECANPAECKLYASFPPISTLVERLANARNSRERLRALLSAGIPRVGNKGRQRDWPDISEVRDAFDELRSLVAGSVSAVVTEALAQVCERLRSFTVDGAIHRRLAGGLEFHDLLTRARWLLRDSPAALHVRTALSQQYQRLLIDEFQDTDPIQIELARLIAFPDGPGALSAEPERLFFVGDPKQSIYRFRRADIALYMEAQQRLGQELGSVVSLTTNFRTLPEVVAWINDVFSLLITEVPGVQPPYRALATGRQPPTVQAHAQDESRVTVLGLPAHPAEAHIEDIREAESEDVAGAITTIMKESWTVIDPDTGTERYARPSDIAVLIPKRTGLAQLEDALSEAGISYRLEAASFVWRTQMVRDLMMCLRAVADPTDALAVASALRTPVYGCGDDDLYLHRVSHHGSWNYTDPRLAEGADTPVTEALAHLRSLHLRHTVLGPAELIDSLASERRMYEQVAARPRPRDAWRQIRYVVDQARAWSDSQHGGLRGFLTWATGQASENSRITESILPESDDDAVRVMTIHAAKGLEFPIVIVAGLQDKPRKRTGVQVIFGSDDAQPEIRVRGDVESHDFWERNEAEIVALHYERLRLLYVACTRARDHLIVSVHRKPRPRTTGGEHNLESGELLANAVNRLIASDSSQPLSGETWQARDFRALGAQLDTPVADDSHDDGTLTAGDRRGATAPDGTADAASDDLFGGREQWLQRHAAAVRASRKPAYLSASALAKQHAVGTVGARGDVSDESGLASELDAAGLSKDDESADIGLAAGSPARAHGDAANGTPPMRHGRYGTALGSAVHAVLQSIDIADPTTHGRETLRALANICARDHGASGREREVLRRVETALASPMVAEAARGRFWQEVFVTAPLDDGLVLEGFIDLLYETPEGRLVVVDFKTDAIADSDTVEQKTAYYRLQGATYAWCAQQATGMEVERIVFQFLTRDAVAEGVIEGADLAQALDEVPSAAQSARGGGW